MKKWQSPDKEAANEYARWFVAVKSPMTGSRYDMGDEYVRNVQSMGTKIENPVIEKW